jgi:integrase
VKGAAGEKSAERPVASIQEVISALQSVPERLRLALVLAAWCQLRLGEILGLQRRDVDLTRDYDTIPGVGVIRVCYERGRGT